MFVRRMLTACAVLSAFVVAPAARGQWSATVSGGATIPTGDYGKYANTGWVGSAGLLYRLSKPGVAIGATGMYGSNGHSDVDGDKTNLTGVLGVATYRLGDVTKPGVYLVGNVGWLNHSYKSDKFPQYEDSKSGVAFGAGAGFAIPRNNMNWYVNARYLMASIDGETTSFIPIQAGVTIPLGSKK